MLPGFAVDGAPVSTVFYYQLQTLPSPFDSGLLDESTGGRRPAFCAIVRRPAAGCKGSPFSPARPRPPGPPSRRPQPPQATDVFKVNPRKPKKKKVRRVS